MTFLSWKYDAQNPADDGSPIAYRFTCSECTRSWPKREMRSALAATLLDADRRLDYQLSYASKYTMLSKLMRRFHERLLGDGQRRHRLATGFAELVTEFRGVPEFAEFQRLLSDMAEEFGQNLPYRLDIDFSAYDPSNFFRSLRVHPSFSGEVRSFDELGTGQGQVLALAFAYAYAKAFGRSEGMILVIDEPEANLHPLAQQWLATRLNNLVTEGLQVVLTTHSPHFVDLSRPDNQVLVSKQDGQATRVVQRSREELQVELVARGADPVRTQPGTLGPFYAASATTEIVSGLFARRCVLVEGPTEALALPALLRTQGLDILREGIAVVSVEGISNIAKWYRLYSSLGIECFCLFDTDSNKTGADAGRLLANRRDIMAALGLEAAKAEVASLSGEPLRVEESFATLNPNFERAAAELFGQQWSQLLEEAVPVVGDSKPLRARYAVERLDASQFSARASDALRALSQRLSGVTQADLAAQSAPHNPWEDAGDPWGHVPPNPWESTPPAPPWEAPPNPWASDPAPPPGQPSADRSSGEEPPF